MARIQVEFISQMFNRTVTFSAILPTDRVAFGTFVERENQQTRDFKTLYLLNPGFGNHSDFITGTRIQEWAEARNLAVIMPAGENQFYVDKPLRNQFYGRYIGEELVRTTREMFPLSRRREDTYIAGCSMGAFGAIVNGLKYHETFGRIGALSPGIINDDVIDNSEIAQGIGWGIPFLEDALGGRDRLKGSDSDVSYMVESTLRDGRAVTPMYISVGTDDFMHGATTTFQAFLDDKGVENTFTVVEGGQHSWELWNPEVQRLLEWLP